MQIQIYNDSLIMTNIPEFPGRRRRRFDVRARLRRLLWPGVRAHDLQLGRQGQQQRILQLPLGHLRHDRNRLPLAILAQL